MNEKPIRRMAAWKLWLGVLMVVAAILAGFGGWVWRVADRRWEEMRSDGRRRFEEARRRVGAREILRGESIPGSAWEDYRAADAILRPIGVSPLLSDYGSCKPVPEAAKVGALLDSGAPAVDLFRRGTRHADGQYPWDWSKFPDEAMVSMSTSLRLTDFMLAWARREAESGRGGAAAELALEVIRYWQDTAFNVIPLGSVSSIDGARRALDLVRWMLLKGSLPAEEFPELERELALLDRTMPSFSAALANNQVYLARRLEEGGVFEFARYLGGPTWRYAFSPRLQVVDWYFQLGRETDRMASRDRMSWSEESALWSQLDFDRSPKSSRSGIATGDLFKSWSADLRLVQARLRLLRSLLHRRVTGSWPDLEDPFGARLRYAESEGLLRAWSVGPSGVDREGAGTWEYRAGREIVLEMRK